MPIATLFQIHSNIGKQLIDVYKRIISKFSSSHFLSAGEFFNFPSDIKLITEQNRPNFTAAFLLDNYIMKSTITGKVVDAIVLTFQRRLTLDSRLKARYREIRNQQSFKLD